MAASTDAVFDALRQAVQADPDLQARLFGLSDRQAFIAEVRRLAQGLGYALEEADVQHAMLAGWQTWSERRRLE
ncbi:MAG: Nif11 family protein [Betaproteobacteria bacterium]|nr:Nif11 family protein [Betaproteobacteria bacterium]